MMNTTIIEWESVRSNTKIQQYLQANEILSNPSINTNELPKNLIEILNQKISFIDATENTMGNYMETIKEASYEDYGENENEFTNNNESMDIRKCQEINEVTQEIPSDIIDTKKNSNNIQEEINSEQIRDYIVELT